MGNETRTLWISLAVGVFAAFLLYGYSQEKMAEVNKKFGATKKVVVALQDIAEMQTIDDTMVDVKEFPQEFIGPNAVTEPERAVGQVAAAPIKKGEQLLQTKLLTPGPDTGLSLQVTPNKRAVTLPVDEMRGVAKLVRPGDRIDIFAIVDSGRGMAAKREVTVLMQDVVVLATGVSVINNIPRTFELDASGKNVLQQTLVGDTKFSTITVEATPKEAQDLIYLLASGPSNLWLTLRNPNDRTVIRQPSSTNDSITGKPSVNFDQTAAPGAGQNPAGGLGR